MIINENDNFIGWNIEPQTFDEYQKIKPEIEALMKKFNTIRPVSTVDSIWVEMPELTRSQFEAGWPHAEPPSHGCEWPQAVEPHPTDHEMEDDSENYPFDQYREGSTDFEN